MTRLLTLISTCALAAACGGAEPWQDDTSPAPAPPGAAAPDDPATVASPTPGGSSCNNAPLPAPAGGALCSGKQPDTDGDGLGDACDPRPFSV